MDNNLKEVLKEIRRLSGKSQDEFAQSVGITRSLLSQIEIGRSTPTFDTLANIISKYDVDANELFNNGKKTVSKTVSKQVSNPSLNTDNGQKPRINQIGQGRPVYNIIATAGSPELFSDEPETVIGYIDMPAFNDVLGWIRVTGDSMYPKYRAGDYIAVKEQEDKDAIAYGHAFYVITKDQKMLKYLRRHEKKECVILRSENSKFDDMDLPKRKILKLYRVKGLLRDID
jgi:phage repressor protein C with HTH and peptisase S24 domain